MTPFCGRKGFTLVELMVSITIFVVLVMALYGILRTGMSVYLTDGMLLDLQQEARNGMDRIVREVRQSKASSIMVGNADSDVLVFSTPSTESVR